jgi:hypothetical protein
VTPTKNPKQSFSKHRQQRSLKINTKENGKTTLRNNAKPSIHIMKVHTRSSLPPKYPSLSHEALKLVLGKTRENGERKWKKTNELGFQELAAIHPLNVYKWRHPKD